MSKKAKEDSGEDYSYTQNREISWLKFNERVLEEAADESVALFERLKFAAIFSSNLDEFYMIRVGSLLDLSLIREAGSDNKSGLTPQEQLDEIFRLCRPLYRHKDDIFEDVMGQLKEHDIFSPDFDVLTEKESKFAENYFKDYIRPVLSPQVVDTHHPFPHLENEALYIIVKLMHKGSALFGIVPVPKNLPRILYLPGVSVRFLLVEDIIKEYTDSLFDMYSVDGKTLVRVTRNADINLESVSSDEDEDYRHYMKSILKKRDRLAPVRLEIQGKADKQAEQYLCPHLNLKKDQVFVSRSPVDMSYVYQLKDKIPASVRRHLLYPEFEPCKSDMVSAGEPIHKQAARRDILLFYPYESMSRCWRLSGSGVRPGRDFH